MAISPPILWLAIKSTRTTWVRSGQSNTIVNDIFREIPGRKNIRSHCIRPFSLRPGAIFSNWQRILFYFQFYWHITLYNFKDDLIYVYAVKWCYFKFSLSTLHGNRHVTVELNFLFFSLICLYFCCTWERYILVPILPLRYWQGRWWYNNIISEIIGYEKTHTQTICQTIKIFLKCEQMYNRN